MEQDNISRHNIDIRLSLFIIFFNEIYKTNNLGITMLYALFIIIIFIPIIQFIHNYFPWIIGKNKNTN